jgi:hypothetical protein
VKVCAYPDCDCAVSFPEGYKPSVATECLRPRTVTSENEIVYFFKDGAIHTDARGVEAIKNAANIETAAERIPLYGLARYAGCPVVEHTPEEMADLEKDWSELTQKVLRGSMPME